MAAKKTSSSKKKSVAITLDSDTLQQLTKAVESLLEIAAVVNMGVADASLKKELTGGAKKKSAKKRAKKRG